MAAADVAAAADDDADVVVAHDNCAMVILNRY